MAEPSDTSSMRVARFAGTEWAIIIAVGFAVLVFLVSEFMHYLLVPELGRHEERMLAEGGAALIVGSLVGFLFRTFTKLRQATVARLQVIAEMNHHIRNALAAISLSTYVLHNEQAMRIIGEAVDRIEWTLREILPRQTPMPESGRYIHGANWRKQH